MEEKKKQRFEYTTEEYKTERKRGNIFSVFGLILVVIAVSVFVFAHEVKVIPPNLAVRVCYVGFLFFGLVIVMNGLVMIQAANIRLERSMAENVNELGKLVDEVKEEAENAQSENK